MKKYPSPVRWVGGEPISSSGGPSLYSTAGSAMLMLSALAGHAASFNADFNNGLPVGARIYGSAVVENDGGVGNSGALKLTSGLSQQGFLVLDDLDPDQPLAGFRVAFNARAGSDAIIANQGNGFSFSFAPDIPDGAFPRPEEGVGSGLRVSFDTYNNGGAEAPAIEVTFAGVELASRRVNFLPTGPSLVPVVIRVDPDGTLDVVYNGNTVISNLTCYAPISGRFSFAAETPAQRFVGDPVDRYFIDDLDVTTTPVTDPYVKRFQPQGAGVRPDGIVKIELQDTARTVASGSIRLSFDGSVVVPTISQADGVTRVEYDPPGLLQAGSSHQVELTYGASGLPVFSSTIGYSFVVYPYVTLSPAHRASPDLVISSDLAFKVRPHQVSLNRGTTIDRAERQFANTLLNPVDNTPLPNIADLSQAGPDGAFTLTPINFDPAGGGSGHFPGDQPFPGIAGNANYALEVLAYLDLAPGTYTFGVRRTINYDSGAETGNRDAGFKLTVGPNPRDVFSPVVASFDNGKGDGDTVFSLVVTEGGFYPFRLLWFAGLDGGDLEWYSIDNTGQKLLIGDPFTFGGAIPAHAGGLLEKAYVRYLPSPAPGAVNVPGNTTIAITLADGQLFPVSDATVQLALNGLAVTPVVSYDFSTGLTEVTYDPPGNLPPGSTNTIRLIYSDEGGTAMTNTYSFVVEGSFEDEGTVVVEAEHFDGRVGASDHTWELTTAMGGYSGDGAMEALPNVNLNVNINTVISPRLDYLVEFTQPGTYYVWVRGLADSAPGAGQNDSINVGLDGTLPATSDRIGFFPFGAGYVWSGTTLDGNSRASLVVETPGRHTINVWMREDGFLLDKVLLSNNPDFVPTGSGPPEKPAILVVEAERFDSKAAASDHAWEVTTANAGFSGEGAMEATPNVNLNVNINTAISPRLNYNVEFVKPGTYHVWVRGLADSAPGAGQNDSINVGLDGVLPATSDRIGFFPFGAGYVWSKTTLDGNAPATFVVATPGLHEINVWMREDGFIIDKILLTTSADYVPAGAGPAERGVLLAFEAERFDARSGASDHTWEPSTANAGFSGDGSMEALPNVNLNVNIDTAISPRMDYLMNFVKTGPYYVWVRGLADSAPGAGQNDSVNVGLDGVLPSTSDRIGFFPFGAGYVWSRTTLDGSAPAILTVPSAGPHTAHVWMREDGFIIDKVVLARSADYTPTGFGPPEFGRVYETRIGIARSAASLTITWTRTGALQAADSVEGPYQDVPGAVTSPVNIPLDKLQQFYRIRRN